MSNFLLIIFVVVTPVVIFTAVTDATLFISRNPNNIKFLLFKDYKNIEFSNEIPYGNEKALIACGYNVSKPLILLLHDALSNSKTPNDIQLIKNAYLEDNFNANIIIVDYGRLTISRNVPFILSPLSILTSIASRFNSNIIAKRVAEFICFGINTKVIDGPQNVHIVGFGLGAHIAGNAGRIIMRSLSKPIRRITGLDPSRKYPLLRNSGLDESDAQFVDVTYTSVLFDIGIKRGHAQYYLNGGGPHQPNCPNLFPFIERYCSHTTAVYYFAKSIKYKTIPACKCWLCRSPIFQPKQCIKNDLSVYGHCVPEGIRGNFFVGLS